MANEAAEMEAREDLRRRREEDNAPLKRDPRLGLPPSDAELAAIPRA